MATPDKLNEEELAKVRNMVETWENVQLGIRTVAWIGRAIKWIIGLVISAIALWATWKHGIIDK